MAGGLMGGGRAARYARRPSYRPMSEINVTPLVDVMLVLLIIFMVAAPMMTAGVQVDLPNADAPPMETEQDQLILSIDVQQRVYLGEAEVPMDRLEEALRTTRPSTRNSPGSPIRPASPPRAGSANSCA